MCTLIYRYHRHNYLLIDTWCIIIYKAYTYSPTMKLTNMHVCVHAHTLIHTHTDFLLHGHLPCYEAASVAFQLLRNPQAGWLTTHRKIYRYTNFCTRIQGLISFLKPTRVSIFCPLIWGSWATLSLFLFRMSTQMARSEGESGKFPCLSGTNSSLLW